MALLPEVKKHYGNLKLLIDGEWVESRSTVVNETTNPATGEVIATFPEATNEEARAAVEAAHRAFKGWKEVCLRDRAKLLFDLRAKLEEKFDELTRILTQDHGRTIDESRGSVRRVIENVESACAAAYGLVKENEHLDQLATGIDQWLVWEPLGAFLIVTPGNIPMHAWSSFVPYALAAGCTVVVSPSRQDPVAADAITRAAWEAGFPKGVLNLIHGGRHINAEILRQPEVQGIGFIGSTSAGWDLYRQCGELGKVSSLNGNGKNNVVIMPDADYDQAAQWLLRSCYGMNGQRCLGSDNVIVVGDRHDELKEKFVAAARSMKLGYGLEESADQGPMCTPAGRQKVLDWIDRALAEGGKMVLDGRSVKVEGYEKGYFLAPSILENGNPEMPTAKEEAFGPVAMLMRAKSLDEALAWINGTNYGHSACIFTESGKVARKFTREAEVGNIGVNVAVPQPYAFFPLGSKKESFLGSAKSRMASMRLFLDEKTVTARWV
ncbi:MAG: aldehyde dehydrogenase family protein [Deltaproteobacteria bacterium]|nr:aldehyde dehydrogenase family protein [Deltaproteobacteria bacterium]